jgi:hypothetical protein
MGAKVAPAGTVTVTLVAVAAVTVARVAPKNTILSVVVVLKLVPVRITASPGFAKAGENEAMVGGNWLYAKLLIRNSTREIRPILITLLLWCKDCFIFFAFIDF